MRTRAHLTAAASALMAVAVVCTPAAAGPPLICHPVEIGDARCLPLPAANRSDQPPKNLTADTLSILAAERAVPVHMETLRRATIAIGRDKTAALEFVSALMARALNAASDGASPGDEALTWLDAGYMIACLKQNGVTLDFPAGTASGNPGYAWVKQALVLDGENAGLHFAAVLVTVGTGGREYAAHLAKAKALAGDGTLVARNLSAHAELFGDREHARRG